MDFALAEEQEHLRQEADFIPRIRRGEVMVCLGRSEPGAGSDLASLQTRAVADGDDFIINGQKVWTSGAQHADYCYLVAAPTPTPPSTGASASSWWT